MESALPFISEAQVRQVLSFDLLIPSLKQALIDFSSGHVNQPLRTVLFTPQHNGWFGVMPAAYGEFMGVKMVTFYPGNRERGLPTHQAVIQLFRSATGEPLACMDGRLITEMRTAAVSALAADMLAPDHAPVLAIVGSGVQARSHFHALSRVRQFSEVRIWSPTRENARNCAAELGASVMPTAEAAVRDADVVVTVTSASEPVLLGRWLKPHAFVVAVGAVGPTRRELDNDAMQATVVVESREAAMSESGDIILSRASITAELGELLAKKSEPSFAGRVVYKSLGIAIEDLVAASLVYQALK